MGPRSTNSIRQEQRATSSQLSGMDRRRSKALLCANKTVISRISIAKSCSREEDKTINQWTSSVSFTSFCVRAFTLKHTFHDDNWLLMVPFTLTVDDNDDRKHLIPLFGIGKYNLIIYCHQVTSPIHRIGWYNKLTKLSSSSSSLCNAPEQVFR